MGEQLYSTEKIIAALQEANGLVSIAARNLRCSPQTVYDRADAYPSRKWRLN